MDRSNLNDCRVRLTRCMESHLVGDPGSGIGQHGENRGVDPVMVRSCLGLNWSDKYSSVFQGCK
jgi:hypothetical protein